MVGFNELLKKRNTFPKGSERWREFDRASLSVQMNNQISSVTKQLGKMPQWKERSQFERQDYARNRAVNFLTDYE
ncbi:MAG: hypothetical protein WBL93_06585, partial [Lutisporaceae bacterium]